jgi:phosphoserine aminotransferase
MALDPATIRLPPALIPGDGRFGSGPSKVRDEAVARLSDAAHGYLGTSHRREGVRAVVRRARGGLTDLFSLPDGYEVLLGNGGTSAFWDAAALGLIERRSQHLSFGEFSARFAGVTADAPFLEDPDVVESPAGTHPEAHANANVDAYALTHNETSTGVMLDITRPEGADGLVLVDATSGAGGLRVDPAHFDVYYFAPQKAFGSDGGLWLALCSPAAIERIERVAASGRWAPASLSLPLALQNSRLDQTYNTPALATLFLLVDTLEWMLAHGGLEWAASRCDQHAELIYGWAEASPVATPFVAKPAQRSHVTATIDFEGVDAAAIGTALRANGLLDTEPYRKLGRNQLRIALFPAVDLEDLGTLTRAIDYVIEALA